MQSEIINGKDYAEKLRREIAVAISDIEKTHETVPTLAVVLVGDDPASRAYVNNKIKFTKECGMNSIEHRFPEDTPEAEIINIVNALNQDESVDGILVQLPLPKHINADVVIACIDADKDVDGLTELSAGRLVLGKPGLRPCTPTGCVILAKDALGDLSGKHCVVVGRSILVGKPAALLFLEQNCTVTIAHSRTQDLAGVCRSADILIAAVGRPEMIKGDWVKPGACVIDVGINRVPHPEKQRKTILVGDVDFKSASKVAGAITPVPGGVGPMTISCLLLNTVLAACHRRDWDVPQGLSQV